MEIKEVIEYSLILILGAYSAKKKFFDSKKSEYETMRVALEVWKQYTTELTERVNVLSNEIHELRVENVALRDEIKKLETLLKSK